MDDTSKIIQDTFSALPPATKFALKRVPWKERVRNIANREKLNNDKALLLENETMMLLYSLTLPEDFAENVSEQVELDQDAGNRIAQEVFEEIITDVEKAFESFDPTRAKNSGGNLPEVLPNERTHIVPHVEITPRPQAVPEPPLQSQQVSSPLPQPKAPVQSQPVISKPPSPPAPKQNLASTPTYAEPSQIGPNDDKSKRPDLNFPQSSYTSGQDPYREPLE